MVAAAKEAGAFDAVVSSHWEDGGVGAVALANATMAACAAANATPDAGTFVFLFFLVNFGQFWSILVNL